MEFAHVNELLAQKKFHQLKQYLANSQLADIAELIDQLELKTALLVFRLLPKDEAAAVFAYISPLRQTELSQLVNEDELQQIINDLYFDDKLDFLEEMPATVVKRIIANTSEKERTLINQFLHYPEDSAGSLMTIEYVDLKKEMSVQAALERIRQTAPDKETIYVCYITDASRHLEGTLSLRDLVVATPEQKISDIMHTEIIYAKTNDDKEYMADLVKKYDLLAIPITDNEERLIGIVTVDDVLDVIEDENTEDFHRMAAMQPTNEEYLDSGVLKMARQRITWLLFLMISATFTGYIIRTYQATLETVVALTVFIPMLMDTGGNAGSQSSTLIIRSLALNEVSIHDLVKILWKEFRVSIVVGFTLAFVNFFRILLIERYSVAVAATVSLTLVFTVITAKIVGASLPIIAKQLKIDPAIMASPIITTVVDTISLIIYFGLATRIMMLG
ncbi:MAG TPA: magnesium transporter [Oscillospiraceae bacterium]|nr:magnesium transporter [Oscillospiraceae bacterium]